VQFKRARDLALRHMALSTSLAHCSNASVPGPNP
jgi:hypothetical protein